MKVLLWDIDGTILNFIAAEKAAIRTGFKRLNLGECTDEMLSVYSNINVGYWKKLELGEMSKSEILIARFRDFFEKYGLDVSLAETFNAKYQIDLGDTVCFNDNSFEILKRLNNEYMQYAVTNGTAVAQHKKLSVSGLDDIFIHAFISDEIGAEKPSVAFFEKVFERLKNDCGDIDKNEIMIIGDSLSSDIKGGNNAGIVTCWYNPGKNELKQGYSVDYEIADINDIFSIL
ncbi:MAG: YjjG family noncanonical pyrimidine nucleotidase [Lachnospiraceae bacterium]|nr:YjjG family noncanonical pyrimidine nucleotidase [Lachnospiraceae bacterium]